MSRITPPTTSRPPEWRMREPDYFKPGDGIRVSPWRHTGQNVPHFHDFIEIAIVVGGSAIHESPHRREPIARGNALIIRPGAWHAYWECRGLHLYNCLIRTETLETTLRWLHLDPLANDLLWDGPLSPEARGILRIRLDEPAIGRCLEHLKILAALDAAGGNDDPLDEIGRLLLIISELARAYEASRPAGARAEARLHPVVSQAIRMLDRDLAGHWTLTELAARLRIDPSYLARLFTAGTGLPPMSYLGHRRLHRAAALLAGTTTSVADIAHQTGFSSPAHFAQRFKLQFGCSATAYRSERTRSAVADGA